MFLARHFTSLHCLVIYLTNRQTIKLIILRKNAVTRKKFSRWLALPLLPIDPIWLDGYNLLLSFPFLFFTLLYFSFYSILFCCVVLCSVVFLFYVLLLLTTCLCAEAKLTNFSSPSYCVTIINIVIGWVLVIVTSMSNNKNHLQHKTTPIFEQYLEN